MGFSFFFFFLSEEWLHFTGRLYFSSDHFEAFKFCKVHFVSISLSPFL